MKPIKQVEALRAATEQKKQQSRQKTVDALSKLTQQGKPISMAAVAREAGVSTVYLYKHPDLRQQIQTLQAQQQQESKRTHPKLHPCPLKSPSFPHCDKKFATCGRRIKPSKRKWN